MDIVVQIVGLLVQFLAFAIFARAILSWFPIDKNGPVFQFLAAVTDPILEPLRRVIPPVGMLDLTPMIAMFLLFFVGQILATAEF